LQLGIQIHENIDDYSLRKLVYQSELMYLPVTAASGNNALFESLAMGTPVFMSNVFLNQFFLSSPAVNFTAVNQGKEIVTDFQTYFSQSTDEKQKVSDFCRKVAAQYDWRVIAERTVAVYEK
jgi:glycosyltransferase involved in cell wall biosynthesis